MDVVGNEVRRNRANEEADVIAKGTAMHGDKCEYHCEGCHPSRCESTRFDEKDEDDDEEEENVIVLHKRAVIVKTSENESLI